jgi:hypothetical protein
MSNEKETRPRKAPAKKAVASSETKAKVAAKPKAAAAPKAAAVPKAAAPKAKAAVPKAKAAAQSAVAAGVPEVARTANRVVPARPTHHQIAELAYSYFKERGWRHGFHEQDWLRAEHVLTSR